jgi:hypothetical protein
VASITTWMKLEPGSRSADMNTGLQARVYDPLWLLARQWQLGEFQGEDNGSPAVASWHGESAHFSRYSPGPLPAGGSVEGRPFDSVRVPLETLVESEPVPQTPEVLARMRFAADTGRQYLRFVARQPLSRDYRPDILAAFGVARPSPTDRAALDPESLAFVDLLAGRVPDGRRLYAALKAGLHPAPPAKAKLPPELKVEPGDSAEVLQASALWLQWVDEFMTAPAAAQPAWLPERLEYAFSLAARIGDSEKVVTAREYYSGRIDWDDFSLNPGASLRAVDGPTVPVVKTTIPAPVTYRGMPAARFWEFEDARVDFGAVDAGPQDLVRLLLVEFALSYGNDWFVIPIDLEAGTLSRSRSLVVTNTFGERFVIHSSSEVGGASAAWRMFQLSGVAAPGTPLAVPEPGLFLLPPALIGTIESRPVEEVLFLRDETSNMAWGVEKAVESAIERPLPRAGVSRTAAAPESPPDGREYYTLATTTPDNWIPLVPMRVGDELRLRRGQVLRPDGSRTFIRALGAVLNPDRPDGVLSIHEEEVPREGARVTRTYQLARWQDGSTHLWIGRRKRIGRGEGSSGLRFDRIERRDG